MAADVATTTTWKPTKKWIAAAISGLLLVAVNAVASGSWDTTEWGELSALIASLAASYVRPNDPTPGGVPVK